MKLFTRLKIPFRYLPFVTLALIALIVLCFLFQSRIGATDKNYAALSTFFGLSRDSLRNGHLARLITANFFHVNLGHLLSNVAGLAFFSSLLEIVIGKPRAVIVILLSALGGTIGSLSIHMVDWMVGSSTILFGVFGGLGVLIIKYRKGLGRFFVTALVSWCVCLVPLVTLGYLSLGVVDQGAHAGGFAAGIVATAIIAHRFSMTDRDKPLDLKGKIFLTVLAAVFGLCLLYEVVPLLPMLG